MKRLALLAAAAVLGLPLAAETITTVETSDGKAVRTQTTRTTVQKDGLTWEIATSKEGTSRKGTTAGGELKTIDVTAPEGQFQLTCQGTTLKVSGTWEGKALSGALDVKDKVWTLDFGHPLKWYAQKGFAGPMPFLMVNPGDLANPTAMVLVKEGEETQKGRKVARLKLTLDGPMALFWSAQVWADPATGEMVRYRGNKGPGTPDSVIEVESVVP